METIVKYSLNPLATAFVPSSMKKSPGSITNKFSIIDREKTVAQIIGSKKSIRHKQKTVTEFFGTTKETHTEVVHEATITKFFGTTKKTLVEGTIVTEESCITTKKVLSPVRETLRDTTGKATSGKLNGHEISDKRSKERTGTKDMSLKELDVFLPKKQFTKGIFEINILRDEAKFLTGKWPFLMSCAVDMDWLYRVERRTITLCMTIPLTLNNFSVTKFDSNQITYPSNVEKTEVTDAEEKGDECQCPPMFGWIVPLDFFGNPLKLKDTCSKKFIHTSYVDGSEKHSESEYYTVQDEDVSLDINDEAITLEQCSSELKTIIKDVCDSVDHTLSLSCDQGNEEPSQTEVSKTRKKRPVWNTPTESERSKLETIDDVSHPLLKETPFVDTDDSEISSIQEFLGIAFSSCKARSEPTVHSSTCIPPCSIWCSNVPPPAKDTYKRFIKKLDPQSSSQRNVNDVNRKTLKKPLYKRCFSADDTPKSFDFKVPLQSVSRCESKERLLLLRKDPVAFIKNSNILASNDSNRKPRSAKFSVVPELVSTKDHHPDENLMDSWSPYDSADSMWQPLPDCVPLSDHAQKNPYKRVRDIRRQRSVC